MASDPEPSRSELVARTRQARVQSRALRELVADAAEAVARVEDEVARVHETIAGQSGPLAEQARTHAARAREMAAKENPEAERRRLGPDGARPPGWCPSQLPCLGGTAEAMVSRWWRRAMEGDGERPVTGPGAAPRDWAEAHRVVAERLVSQSEQVVDRVSDRIQQTHRRVQHTYQQVQELAAAVRLTQVVWCALNL